MKNEWTEPCPWCGRMCECDLVDVGVGFVQAGPYHCEHCNASQIGPFDDKYDPHSAFKQEAPGPNTRILTAEESKAGWYAPESGHGSSANVIGGRVVGHRAMRDTYKAEFTGNPLYEDKNYVDEWWRKAREP